jgi:hypothetical protein
MSITLFSPFTRLIVHPSFGVSFIGVIFAAM